MAIPFHLPSDEETLDNYRRLDQLLIDLYEIVRIILLRTRNPPEPPQTANVNSNHVQENRQQSEDHRTCQVRRAGPTTESSNEGSQASTQPASRKPPVAPPRRKRRSRLLSCRHHEHVGKQQLNATPSSAWLNVGIELRQIAQEFRTVNQLDGVVTEKKRMEVKASSLFSLLVPSSFNSTIWTTVVLIVGWKLLAKSHR